MPGLSKVEHHDFSNFVPFTIWLADMSSVPLSLTTKSHKWPTSVRELLDICCNIHGIRHTIFRISLCSLSYITVHWHEDDPSFELPRFTPQSVPIDSIQFFEIACLQILFNFVIPGLHFWTNASWTEHLVGKDVGFGICNLNSSIT